MDENVGRKKRGRNLRACTKCNIGLYDPKDDNCPKICSDRGDGNEPVWIFPVGMQAGRRRAQRRRMANNRHQNNESGEIIEPGVEISSGDHFDGDMDDFDCKRFANQRTFGRTVLNKV